MHPGHLVGVTADIFLISVILLGQLPFEAGGESAASAAAQTGI